MTRVSTITLQRTMSNAIQRSQENLATSQLQLASGKKTTDFAGLGLDAVRTLSARSMLAQQTSYQSTASRVSTTLSLYQAHLSQIDETVMELRESIITAIGTENSPSLQKMIEGAYSDIQASLNASQGGFPLFAGSQIDSVPLPYKSLDQLQGINIADAFNNDNIKSSGRLSDGLDMEYGITASDVGSKLLVAFRALADAGPYGENLTAAQKTALGDAIGLLDEGIKDVRAIDGSNGRNLARVETMNKRAAERIDLLTEVIGSVEDADLGQVAIDITQRQTILQASYSVFSQLNSMSLAQFLN